MNEEHRLIDLDLLAKFLQNLRVDNAEQLNTAVSEHNADENAHSELFQGGKTVSGSSSYTLDNAVDYPIVDMRIYGKSTQDGVPTPDAPVDIVSVGDSGAVAVTACGKNLPDVKNPAYIRSSVVDAIDGATTTLENNGMTLKSGATNSTWVANRWFYKIKKGTYTISGKISCDDETFTPKLGIYFISTIGDNPLYCSELNPSKLVVTYNFQEDGYIGLYFHLTDDNGITASSRTVRYYDIQLELGDTATAYEPYVGSTANLTSALPLCGIPVSEGENYTDSNGQQWIADEVIYNADGTGKIVKRVDTFTFDGSDDEQWNTNTTNTSDKWRLATSVKKDVIRPAKALNEVVPIICNSYLSNSANGTFSNRDGIAVTASGTIYIYNETCATYTLDEWKSYLASNPMTVVYQLAEPQEINLTAEEMSQLQSLQTFDGTTNISNDGGAEMQIKYCTNSALSEYVKPIKTGLQKQIDELKTAVLSLGGSV